MGNIDKNKLIDKVSAMGHKVSKEDAKKLKEFSSKYGDKNKEELIEEVVKIGKSMNIDEATMKKVNKLKGMLNENQKKTLEKIMDQVKK